MFIRAMFQTTDMIRQHELLERVAALIDEGVPRTTMVEHFGSLDVDNMRRAHALIESGHSRGKVVLEGFQDKSRMPLSPYPALAVPLSRSSSRNRASRNGGIAF
ncbi:zinc-binding dehydrogenase [Halomonas cupida]|uniref:zinc-binding dehydrogenase n=1 Tax=Halomonas cupida TaxID=44933 RepID=UPI0039B550F1